MLHSGSTSVIPNKMVHKNEVKFRPRPYFLALKSLTRHDFHGDMVSMEVVDSRPLKMSRGLRTMMKMLVSFRVRLQHLYMLWIVTFMQLPADILALRQSHYVHWNSTNPIFRIDNTDHIIDVNKGNKPWEYDQVNIICPVYQPGKSIGDIETYVIYSVTKEEYDSCRITDPEPRVIAICNKPHELMYFTITFRSFTPTPGGMEFQPGKDYYFISTSAKDDLYRRVGGHCSSHHMKVAFKVANNQLGSDPTTNKPKSAVNEPRVYGNDGGFPLFLDPDPVSNERQDEDYFHPLRGGNGLATGNIAQPNRRHDGLNEVIKHEASRMASSSVIAIPIFEVTLLSATITISLFL